MFLEQQISILEWFLKDCVTLKTGVMLLNIQFSIKGINYIWTFIQVENRVFKTEKIFHNITSFDQINAPYNHKNLSKH